MEKEALSYRKEKEKKTINENLKLNIKNKLRKLI